MSMEMNISMSMSMSIHIHYIPDRWEITKVYKDGRKETIIAVAFKGMAMNRISELKYNYPDTEIKVFTREGKLQKTF